MYLDYEKTLFALPGSSLRNAGTHSRYDYPKVATTHILYSCGHHRESMDVQNTIDDKVV